jgi:hypothetical protein
VREKILRSIMSRVLGRRGHKHRYGGGPGRYGRGRPKGFRSFVAWAIISAVVDWVRRRRAGADPRWSAHADHEYRRDMRHDPRYDPRYDRRRDRHW